MKAVLKKSWMSLLYHGVLCMLTCLPLLALNDVNLLVQVLGIFGFMSGVTLVAGALYSRKEDENWPFILQTGMLQLILACVALFSPGDTGLRLLMLTGTSAIVIGVSAFIASFKLQQESINNTWLIVSGIASVLFGGWIVFFPVESLVDRSWHIAAYLLVTGTSYVLLTYKVWKLEKEILIHLYEFESQSI
jgi:uncharacterized membrane protein HdeD (DUF308 family)